MLTDGVTDSDSDANHTALTNGDWPGWRGKNRDARVNWLPDSLSASPEYEWTVPLAGEGIGGIAIGGSCVITGSRDVLDRSDMFQCFDVKTGDLIWQHFYPAPGELDYGNSPRATPLIHDGLVYTLGAFGHLYCLELESGLPLWTRNIAVDFSSPEMTWGHSGSPLIAEGKLIVQPGGPKASLVALDPESGEVVWKSPGIAAGYSSFLLRDAKGMKQLLGYDAASLGGWDLKTGRRLWTLIPPEKGDFNVPTVVAVDNDIIVTTENNGTRRYSFRSDGTINPKPVAQNLDLAPDSHTPVISGSRIFGMSNELFGLNLSDLKTSQSSSDGAFAVYGSLVASKNRLLCLTANAELLLLATDLPEVKILSRVQLSKSGVDILSHPAVAGNAFYFRAGKKLHKLKLRR